MDIIGGGTRRNKKSARTESNQVLIARASRAAEHLHVVDAFEKVRLPLSVVSNDRQTLLRNFQIELLEIPEIAAGHPL